jgi:hypothetical protein
MDNFGLLLRNVVFFLFPIPFLLQFAVDHGEDWTGYVAYAAIVALSAAAIVTAWAWIHRRRR